MRILPDPRVRLVELASARGKAAGAKALIKINTIGWPQGAALLQSDENESSPAQTATRKVGYEGDVPGGASLRRAA